MTGQDRLRRLQELMGDRGVDFALFSVGPDLPYLTGYQARASERLNMLVVPAQGGPRLHVPELEAPLVHIDNAEVVSWSETEDPIDLVADACKGARSLAIGDHTWSVFLVRLLKRLGDVTWVEASELMRHIRVVKEPSEIEMLRAAAHAVDRVLARVPAEVRFGGRSEAEVAADLQRMTLEEGHESAEFAIVGSGPNGASPHHQPGARVIQGGDLVVCDFGGTWGGYHSDVTRTFAVGEPDATALEVHAVVLEANVAGRRAVAPGVPCQEVDRAARKVVDAAGYGEYFIHRTGHGIGVEVHEHPYLVEGNDEMLAPGMTFSIEPGVYLPGRMGVRVEDIVACGETGVDELNRADRGLLVVE